MKKLFLILIITITLTGCTNIESLNYDEIINEVISNESSPNVYRNGFKFYLPHGMQIVNAGSNYVVMSSNNTNYYLYIDLINYMLSSKMNYEENSNAVYSKKINYNNLEGYLEINLKENDKYLIEIMYNYAKIELMVDKDDINSSLCNAVNILRSIKYNTTIIEKLLNDDNLDYTEEKIDIFENSVNNSSVLDYTIDSDDNNKTDNEIKDTDFIN